jgi:pimeloyl-ACP methyl ester carboxylesterase
MNKVIYCTINLKDKIMTGKAQSIKGNTQLEISKFSFPVGLKDYHADERLNFQLNRPVTLGLGRIEDIKEAAAKITDIPSFQKEMSKQAEKAYEEGRYFNAVGYFRVAEFFTPFTDSEKMGLFDKMIDAFNQAAKDEAVERCTIPYQGGFLETLHLAPEESKGVIVMCGGYDALIEELYPIASYLAYAGYEVILYEGPGQGSSRYKHGLTFTHEWESPTGVVLDYFKVEDVTLIGMSLGGFLAPRAAAFERRISRVVAWDHYYGFTECTYELMPSVLRLWIKLLMALKAKSILSREPENGHANLVYHGMYLTGTDNFYDWWLDMSQYSFPSIAHLVTQDVLVLAGEEDPASPMKFYPRYIKALKNAKSVMGRVFTKEEHAASHNQIGNIKLALDFILDWIVEFSKE